MVEIGKVIAEPWMNSCTRISTATSNEAKERYIEFLKYDSYKLGSENTKHIFTTIPNATNIKNTFPAPYHIKHRAHRRRLRLGIIGDILRS